MINSIIQWILNLLGLGQKAHEATNVAGQLASGHQDVHAAAAQNFGDAAPAARPAAPAQTSEFIEAHGDIVRSVPGAALIRDEDDGELTWSNLWNKEIRPDQWPDEWGPVSRDQFETFWHHKYEFDLAAQGDPDEAERKLQSFGYRDVGHFFQVETTFLKHFPEAGSGPLLEDLMFDSQLVTKAAVGGVMQMNQARADAAVQANPELLAPVEGVDLDTYAKIAAAAATGTAGDAFDALLAQHGMDPAKWSRVNDEWTDRMSKDTSFAISQAYSKAFAGAGSGQFGGAAAAAAQTMGTTAHAGGEEPVSFERYCEIQGAQTAWSTTGQDVNAMLKHTFGITAGDFANMSMWWMSRMTTDHAMMNRYAELTQKYEAQYGGGAMAGADEDLSF